MDCADVIRELEESVLQGPRMEPPVHIQEHLVGCEKCRAEWVAQQESWLMISIGLSKSEVRPDFEKSVMERIANSSVEPSSASDDNTFWKYALAASVLIALVGGTFLLPNWFLARTTDQDLSRVKEFARQMSKLKQLEETFANTEFRYVSLTTIGSSDHVQGYLVYDFITNDGYFFGYDLDDSNGRTFMLWLLDSQGNVLESAPIDVNQQGVGAATIQLPSDFQELNEIVVSLETQLPADRPSSHLEMRSTVSP